MLKCTINGQRLKVKEGTTIIEAFQQMKDDIAHYCWHPGLSVAGVCRLCMVEVEGRRGLQIACNTPVEEDMVITNQSDLVKDTVKWGLDFHLINHPLDCPICDQAGECGLQEQYMKFGQSDSKMGQPKVKKRKVVDLGSKIVLDTERCILCSRCVRFTEEVSQTNELGIFQRGDRSEIGVVEDKPLENDYALNTVDICPVGALTSKDFRFRQRVWYLKDTETVCPGCSTGCRVKVYHNEEGLFRVKPAHDPENNGYWMCDKGRDVYKFVNPEGRLKKGLIGTTEHSGGKVAQQVAGLLQNIDMSSVGIVVTGQQTCEEYDSLFKWAKKAKFYYWQNNKESFDDFDDLLIRGDKNPNTAGLKEAATKAKVTLGDLDLLQKEVTNLELLIVIGPENLDVYPEATERAREFLQANLLVWASSQSLPMTGHSDAVYQVPLKTYIEKPGTFVNYQGRTQKLNPITPLVAGALTVSDLVALLNSETIGVEKTEKTYLKRNFYTHKKDTAFGRQ